MIYWNTRKEFKCGINKVEIAADTADTWVGIISRYYWILIEHGKYPPLFFNYCTTFYKNIVQHFIRILYNVEKIIQCERVGEKTEEAKEKAEEAKEEEAKEKAEDNVTKAQEEIQKLMDINNMIDEDIKGIEIDIQH